MIFLFAHFNRKCNSIQKSDSLLVFSVCIIWIAASPYRYIVHFRNSYDRRCAFRHIKFFIFLLVVKSHILYTPLSPSLHKAYSRNQSLSDFLPDQLYSRFVIFSKPSNLIFLILHRFLLFPLHSCEQCPALLPAQAPLLLLQMS